MSKHVHLVGIGGSGLSAIARFLLESGYVVSGSDRVASETTQALTAIGARVYIGHDAHNIEGADIIVRSSAIPADNPELIAAQARGIPVLKREEFLGYLTANKTGIAVAGTHGKTTTTAMIAWGLTHMGTDPSYIIGGIARNLSNNAHAGTGCHFVIEADEYDRMFLGLSPTLSIITNIEHDHPDCYPSWEDYYKAFRAFARRLKPGGTLLISIEDPGSARLADEMTREGLKVFTYGRKLEANYRASLLKYNQHGGAVFEATFHAPGQTTMELGEISLQVPGDHNMLNALAALATAHQLGLPLEPFCGALEEYIGAGRRFEVLGEVKGITVLDDYAHHPSEIRATLAAARLRYPQRRIWAVWQPHTYSRTRALLQEFITAFDQADCVLITEIYAAREAPQAFSALQVVHFAATLKEATRYLLDHLQPEDVVIILSAGDANQIGFNVLHELSRKEGSHANPIR
jgi:UDP-N-acetylmuramate--alanine ligase